MAVAAKKKGVKKAISAGKKATSPAAKRPLKTARKNAAKTSAKRPAVKAPAGTTAKKAVKTAPARAIGKKQTAAPKKVVPQKKKPESVNVSGKVFGKEIILKKKVEASASAEKDRLNSLKRILLEKRDAIVKEAKTEIVKYASGDHRQLVDTALDDGDWAVVDTSEDINLLRLAAHRKTLIDIDEALRKIAEGSYGICEECAEEISEKRLSVLPTATLCVSCKEEREQLEMVVREEGG